MRGDFNLDVIADVINKADPDLVALQEVDSLTDRTHEMDLVKELGLRTKMLPLFGKAMSYDNGAYGNGILSKTPLLASNVLSLPHAPNHEPRIALYATTVLSNGDTVSFISTHLDYKKDEKERIAQVKRINNLFALSTYPIILAGDLNAVPGSAPINILVSRWKPTFDSSHPEPTFPSKTPQMKIDYIMVFPGSAWRIISTSVIQDSVASDHCAYLSNLKLLH